MPRIQSVLVLGGVAPGASAGTLTVAGTLALQGGSSYTWEVADWAAPVAGTDYDTLLADDIDVQANAGSTATIVITPDAVANFSEDDRTFTLATAGGALTNFAADAFVIDDSAFAGATGATGSWAIQQNGNSIELVYTAGTDAYTSWAQVTHGLAGGDASGDADPDGGSLQNAIEFVVGGDPNNAADDGPLSPTGSVDGTDFVVVYRRTAESAYLNPSVDYNSDLGVWTTAQDAVNGVSVTVTPDGFGAGVDRVEVRIPQALAAGGRLFARLTATAPF